MGVNDDRYLEWLIDDCDGDDDHTMLFDTLHRIRYTYLVMNDESRAMDGMALRDDYKYETGEEPNVPFFDRPSVLEFLVGLCRRMDNQGFDVDMNYWINMFLENMDLNQFTDGRILDDYDDAIDAIQTKVSLMLWREYNHDGSDGGLFVIPGTNLNMTRASIYDQWTEYANRCDLPNRWDKYSAH